MSTPHRNYAHSQIDSVSQSQLGLHCPFREPYFATGDTESWGTRSDERKRLVRLGFLQDEDSSSREELVQQNHDMLAERTVDGGRRTERMVVRLYNAFQSGEQAQGWGGMARDSLMRASLPVLMKAFVLVLEIHVALLTAGIILEAGAAGTSALNDFFAIMTSVFCVRVVSYLLVCALSSSYVEQSKKVLVLCYAGCIIMLVLVHVGFVLEIAEIRESLAQQWLVCFCIILSAEYIMLDSFHFAMVRLVLKGRSERQGNIS